ncbi:unnamed protein product, partial [Staurois parvus]
HLATPTGSLNSSTSSVIGRRNCSSGEAHRRPITSVEVELGEKEPSGSTKIKEDPVRELLERLKRRSAREGRKLTNKCLYCVCWLYMGEGGSEPRLEQGSAR